MSFYSFTVSLNGNSEKLGGQCDFTVQRMKNINYIGYVGNKI